MTHAAIDIGALVANWGGPRLIVDRGWTINRWADDLVPAKCLLAHMREPVSVAQIGEAVCLSDAEVRRLLVTLRRDGLARIDGRRPAGRGKPALWVACGSGA